MPLLLHIETATDICSIGISQNGELLALQEADKPYSHIEQTTILIQACAKTADVALHQIDAVALSRGPGSYTALRVGTSVAKGLCYAFDKPLIAVDTLQALAMASRQKTQVENALYCPMIDNRRMEVLTAVYDQTGQRQSGIESKIITTDSFADYFAKDRTLVFSGNGAEKCKTVLTAPQAIFVDVRCSARYLIPLAEAAFHANDFANIAYFEPLYVKPPNITRPKKKL